MAAASGTLKDRESCEKMRARLILERSTWFQRYRDLAQYLAPDRGRFWRTDRNRGVPKDQLIVDGSPLKYVEVSAAGMMAYLTSPSRPWFRLVTPDLDLMDDDEVKEWLYQCEIRMREVFAKSNLYNALHIAYIDLLVFGTCAISMVKDEKDGMRFYVLPVGSYAVTQNERLDIDCLVREYQMTVRQVVERFGIDKCSTETQRLWNNGDTETWIDIIHLTAPNSEYDKTKPLDKTKKRYRSVYYEQAQQDSRFLDETGFDQFPVLCPRWTITGEDVYGRSPGMTALPDVKQLQTVVKRIGQAVEKGVNPPLLAPTSMRNLPTSLLPGQITYTDVRDGQLGVRPLHQVSLDISDAQALANELRGRIASVFHADLFQMWADIDRRQMTAEETRARQDEKSLNMGPVLERLGDELYEPFIEFCFSDMLAAGMLPKPPPQIQGQQLKIEFISILTQAQKMLSLSSVDRLASTGVQLNEAMPGILDNLDGDELFRDYGSNLGVDPKFLRSKADVAQMRQGRAQQAQQQNAMQQMAISARATKDMANADTSRQSALTDLAQGLNGAAS